MTHKTDASYKDNVFRKDHYMIFAANRHLASIKSVRLDSTEALKPGQVLARDTGDGYFKKFSAVSGGSFDSVCVLMDELTSSEASGDSLCRGVFGGELYKTALTDFITESKTAMAAREITDAHGDVIVKF